jgi:hypothetical protein
VDVSLDDPVTHACPGGEVATASRDPDNPHPTRSEQARRLQAHHGGKTDDDHGRAWHLMITSIRHDDMTSFIFDSFDSFTKPPRGKGEHRSRAIPAG